MRNLILAGAAALAFTAAPAIAQDMSDDGYMLTDMQQGMYDGWPADRQATYDAWPMDVQEYYWTLTPMQTQGWWMLNDDQRVRIYQMDPESRAKVWTQVSAQMKPNATASAATTASSSAKTAGPRFVSRAVTEALPAGYKEAKGNDLPVCKPNQQTDCINSWAKNKTGTRPLNYWPGKPASNNGM